MSTELVRPSNHLVLCHHPLLAGIKGQMKTSLSTTGNQRMENGFRSKLKVFLSPKSHRKWSWCFDEVCVAVGGGGQRACPSNLGYAPRRLYQRIYHPRRGDMYRKSNSSKCPKDAGPFSPKGLRADFGTWLSSKSPRWQCAPSCPFFWGGNWVAAQFLGRNKRKEDGNPVPHDSLSMHLSFLLHNHPSIHLFTQSFIHCYI